MTKEEVTGYVLGLSHLFYLPKQSKVFFPELLTTTGDKTRLVLSLSSPSNQTVKQFSKSLLQSPKLGSIVKFSHYKDSILHRNSPSQTTVLHLSKRSNIKIVENDPKLLEFFHNLIENNPDVGQCSGLVSYKGVVTSAKDCNSGVYKVDKKLFLFTTPLCVVTNVPRLSAGQEITVFNAHLANFNSQAGFMG